MILPLNIASTLPSYGVLCLKTVSPNLFIPHLQKANNLALLVTCARVPLSVLQGESISVISVPSPSDTEPRPPNLLVSGGGFLLWSFPLDECLSWFVSFAVNAQYLIERLTLFRHSFRILENTGLEILRLLTMESQLYQVIGQKLLPLLGRMVFD